MKRWTFFSLVFLLVAAVVPAASAQQTDDRITVKKSDLPLSTSECVKVTWKNHPELRKGEVFLTNASNDLRLRDINGYIKKRSSWESVGWRTKRKGTVAYDILGGPINWMFPVFVQRDELVKGGIDPDTLWTKYSFSAIRWCDNIDPPFLF